MKVAILIDGGYFLKRIYAVRPDIDARDAIQVDKANSSTTICCKSTRSSALSTLFPLLYRCFFL